MANKYTCEKCGGNLKYNPDTKTLICGHCSTTKEIKNKNAPQKKLLEGKANDESKIVNMPAFHCPNCGASVIAKNSEYSTVCPYCNTALVETHKDIILPEAIIPFAIGKDVAIEKLYNTFKQKLFIPNVLKKKFQIDEIKDVYVPTYSFDALTTSTYSGTLARTRSERDSDGKVSYTTEYQHISGTENLQFQNINIECSSQITQLELSYVGAYDYSQLQSFKEDYILGYSVEQNDKNVEECYKDAKEIIKLNIKNVILNKYYYDYVYSFSMQTSFFDVRYQKSVLPMYIVNYKYKKENRKLYINGQTGRVGGKFPRSVLKILFMVVLPISIVLLIILILMYTKK